MKKTSKKTKQAILQKFSYFINEFKLMASLDTTTRDWDDETKELIDYLCFNWNEYCFYMGQYMHGRLLLIEFKVMRALLLEEGTEKELREKFTAEKSTIDYSQVSFKSKMN